MTLNINHHGIEIVKGNITKEQTEAIVNAANSSKLALKAANRISIILKEEFGATEVRLFGSLF